VAQLSEANHSLGLVSVDGNSVSTLENFNNLATQIANINPSGVNMNSYNPTATAAQACPTVGSAWQANSALPPTPNQELCECMFKALTCIPDRVDDDSIGDLFGTVCGLADGVCDGITANGTSGEYGAYGMCNPQQQLGWALNTYYEVQRAQNNAASACDFSGSAKIQTPVAPTGTCASLISQAGNAGTGTVTSQPSGTGGSGSGSSGSGSGGSSSSSSSSAGIPTFSAPSHLGFMSVALYLGVAVFSGAAMVLL
jgi:hypothetical protein